MHVLNPIHSSWVMIWKRNNVFPFGSRLVFSKNTPPLHHMPNEPPVWNPWRLITPLRDYSREGSFSSLAMGKSFTKRRPGSLLFHFYLGNVSLSQWLSQYSFSWVGWTQDTHFTGRTGQVGGKEGTWIPHEVGQWFIWCHHIKLVQETEKLNRTNQF